MDGWVNILIQKLHNYQINAPKPKTEHSKKCSHKVFCFTLKYHINATIGQKVLYKDIGDSQLVPTHPHMNPPLDNNSLALELTQFSTVQKEKPSWAPLVKSICPKLQPHLNFSNLESASPRKRKRPPHKYN